MDPTDLKPETPRKAKKEEPPAEPARVWGVAEFVAKFVTSDPQTKLAILSAAKADEACGLSGRAAEALLTQAEEERVVFRWKYGPRDKERFATVEQSPSLNFRE